MFFDITNFKSFSICPTIEYRCMQSSSSNWFPFLVMELLKSGLSVAFFWSWNWNKCFSNCVIYIFRLFAQKHAASPESPITDRKRNKCQKLDFAIKPQQSSRRRSLGSKNKWQSSYRDRKGSQSVFLSSFPPPSFFAQLQRKKNKTPINPRPK